MIHYFLRNMVISKQPISAFAGTTTWHSTYGIFMENASHNQSTGYNYSLRYLFMRRRHEQEINAGSMADIAFLLLIFFLVATVIESDIGIMRKLPPLKDSPPKDINRRNILEILVNRNNDLMIGGTKSEIKILKEKTKEFILNKYNSPELPVVQTEKFDYFGHIPVTKAHVISLRSDRGTSYAMYIAVQNELTAAYNELRDELAMEKWQHTFKELPEEKQKIIVSIYPMKISEAEPN